MQKKLQKLSYFEIVYIDNNVSLQGKLQKNNT